MTAVAPGSVLGAEELSVQIPKTFQCPKCGAPIPFHYGDMSAECEFCGSTVAVPAELRPPPPTQAFPPPYPAPQPAPIVPPTQRLAPPTIEVIADARPARRRRSCSATLVLIALLLIASAGVLVFVASKTPFFFANLAAGGFARLDKTYGGSPGAADVTDAVGVAVDGTGNISVVSYGGQVSRFSPDGAALSGWAVEGNDLSIRTIKADNAGNVYIMYGGAIHKYDGAQGFQTKVITVDETFGLYDLAIAPDSSLLSYVGGATDQLVRFDPSGTEVARYRNALSEITGDTGVPPWQVRLATGSDGTIYLLNQDSKYSPVFVYTAEGKYKTRLGAYGDAQDQLQYPQAIAVDGKDRIYIADRDGVKISDADGTYVGIARMPFTGSISGMAFDKYNRLYVVSRSEKKVYRFALNEPQ